MLLTYIKTLKVSDQVSFVLDFEPELFDALEAAHLSSNITFCKDSLLSHLSWSYPDLVILTLSSILDCLSNQNSSDDTEALLKDKLPKKALKKYRDTLIDFFKLYRKAISKESLQKLRK